MNIDFQIFINSILLISVGIFFLRLSGRKSISQMTIAQTVIMISIGSLIVQPIANKSVMNTIIIAGIFIVIMVILDILQVKYNVVEKIITGKAKVVIDNGQLQVNQLKKLRITVDQLELRLRQKGILNISDVKTASIEANGQLGYELFRHAQPVTIGELEKMFQHYTSPSNNKSNVFTELKNNNGITINNNTSNKLK